MREIRTYGSEGGEIGKTDLPYLYGHSRCGACRNSLQCTCRSEFSEQRRIFFDVINSTGSSPT
jgi:hypothetical protein